MANEVQRFPARVSRQPDGSLALVGGEWPEEVGEPHVEVVVPGEYQPRRVLLLMHPATWEERRHSIDWNDVLARVNQTAIGQGATEVEIRCSHWVPEGSSYLAAATNLRDDGLPPYDWGR